MRSRRTSEPPLQGCGLIPAAWADYPAREVFTTVLLGSGTSAASPKVSLGPRGGAGLTWGPHSELPSPRPRPGRRGERSTLGCVFAPDSPTKRPKTPLVPEAQLPAPRPGAWGPSLREPPGRTRGPERRRAVRTRPLSRHPGPLKDRTLPLLVRLNVSKTEKENVTFSRQNSQFYTFSL